MQKSHKKSVYFFVAKVLKITSFTYVFLLNNILIFMLHYSLHSRINYDLIKEILSTYEYIYMTYITYI